MRKWNLIPLLLSLAPCLTQASPAVGDFVEFSVTTIKGTDKQTSTESILITAFDPATHQYEVQTTREENGLPPATSTAWKPAESILPSAALASLGKTCGLSKGVFESIDTPAGTLNACSLALGANGDSGRVWVGNVPFGTIKFDSISSSGEVIKILTKFRSGK